ncbi:rhodanese-like domain-containing protein [Helicobacter heilmannii]|nr:rhodanese-like domain-containing protein [Helicobacter heilmannii]
MCYNPPKILKDFDMESSYTHQLVELKSFNPKDYCVIDIRDAESYHKAHLKEALHMDDLNAIKKFALEHPQDKVLLQCWRGNTAAQYANALHGAGVSNIYFLKADFDDFKTSGLEVLES